MQKEDFVSVFIVPTGVGASIGGFAGDASPAVNLISKICPVIANPNVVNAAVFSGINPNIFYTEGYTIDSFFKGEIALRSSKHNKIGVIFDKAIPEKVLNVHINTLNAVKTVYGLDILGYEITGKEVGVTFSVLQTGISTGNIENPDTLLKSASNLIKNGAEAIAVICYFEDSDDDNYANGQGVDPVGGVEAIISHLIGKEFNIPVAHAPAFGEESLSISSEIVDKRASAEYITPTFLPCILLGLNNAPKMITISDSNIFDIALDSIKSLIVPFDALGNIPVLKAIEKNIPIIAVQDNKTVLDIDAKALNIENKVIKVQNYHEAAGVVLALKEGILF